ncbi:Lipase A [Penicillium subrubescens]|uniref:Lipase A n=1 Tax=Penicillium subrubescens TaxID=1316194 RepID=A0A1Q5U4D5_9EURO|nr:Lipase A [Penicillium subrubescens]
MSATMLSIFSVFLLICAAFAASITPPSQDPWYEQPSNISDYVAGEMIRSRSVPPELESFLALPLNVSVKAVYQYLFRTTDSLGDAVASAVTLIEPYNSDPSKLVGYQAFYDSANIAAALNLGWWVFTTDYEGLNAEFTVGLQSGHAVLDSTRVVLDEGPSVGLSRNPRYALWGYSGGALASIWAAELQSSYAPELNYAGVAVGGTTPNTTSVLQTINTGSHAGLAFSATYGQSKAFPNLTNWLSESLVPSKSAQFYSIASGCLSQATSQGSGQDFFTYFKNGEASFNEDVPRSIHKWSGQMGLHGTPTAPMFVYKSTGDEISPVEDTDDLVKKYCGAGARIEYHRDLVGTHETEAISGSASALEWISDRLKGKAVESGCSTKNVLLSSLSAETVALLGEELFALLQAVLGGML